MHSFLSNQPGCREESHFEFCKRLFWVNLALQSLLGENHQKPSDQTQATRGADRDPRLAAFYLAATQLDPPPTQSKAGEADSMRPAAAKGKLPGQTPKEKTKKNKPDLTLTEAVRIGILSKGLLWTEQMEHLSGLILNDQAELMDRLLGGDPSEALRNAALPLGSRIARNLMNPKLLGTLSLREACASLKRLGLFGAAPPSDSASASPILFERISPHRADLVLLDCVHHRLANRPRQKDPSSPSRLDSLCHFHQLIAAQVISLAFGHSMDTVYHPSAPYCRVSFFQP